MLIAFKPFKITDMKQTCNRNDVYLFEKQRYEITFVPFYFRQAFVKCLFLVSLFFTSTFLLNGVIPF